MVPVDQYDNDYDPVRTYSEPAFDMGVVTVRSFIAYYKCRLVINFGHGHTMFVTKRVYPELWHSAVPREELEAAVRKEMVRSLRATVETKLNEIWSSNV